MDTHSDSHTLPQNGNGNGHVDQVVEIRPHPPIEPRSSNSMGWKLAITAIVLAAALAVGFFIVHRQRADQEANLSEQTKKTASELPTVDAVIAKAAPSSLPLELPGETRGWYQSPIYARIDGYVANWTADIGDHVHKGQVLATIATPDLDAQLQAAIQQLAVAKSGITVAQANAAFAKTTYERWHNSPPGVVAPQETDEKKAAYDSSVAQLQAAQSKVSAAIAEVDRLKALESYKQVAAPYDGIITSRRIDIGNLVTAGSTTNTSPLYDIAQTDVIRVFADIPQDASSQITIGTPTRTVSDNFPGRVFIGKVVRTSRAIDQATRTLKVEVDIPNPDLTLMPGMYVRVAFEIKHSGLVEVPASAMLFRSAGPQVAVVSSNGTIEFRNVQISVDDGNTVDVSTGVKAGDRLVLNLSSQITDGQRVNVANADQPAPTQSTASGDTGE